MTSTTDTPRTDAIRRKYGMNSVIDAERVDYSKLCRQLERELLASQAEVERLRAFIANDFRDKLRRAIEIAKELDILGSYRVGGPFEIQEKLERRAELLAELDQISATLNQDKK